MSEKEKAKTFNYTIVAVVILLTIFIAVADSAVQTIDITELNGYVLVIAKGVKYLFALPVVIVVVGFGRVALGYLWYRSKEKCEFEWQQVNQTWITFAQGIIPLVVVIESLAPQIPEAKWVAAGIVFIVHVVNSAFKKAIPTTSTTPTAPKTTAS